MVRRRLRAAWATLDYDRARSALLKLAAYLEETTPRSRCQPARGARGDVDAAEARVAWRPLAKPPRYKPDRELPVEDVGPVPQREMLAEREHGVALGGDDAPGGGEAVQTNRRTPRAAILVAALEKSVAVKQQSA